MPTPAIELGPVLPELIVVGVGVVLLLAGVVARKASPTTLLVLCLAGIAAAAVATVRLWDWEGGPAVLAGSISTDRFGVVVRLIILGVAALGAVLGHHYFERSGEGRAEFYPLLLFATAGMTLFAVSADLIMAFLALEILSLSLYVLTGFSTRLGSVEGAMKYFLLGSFSSAFFLFGIAMAYGASGSTRLPAIADALAGRTGSVALAVTAMGLLAVGFAFKVSAVPFHMWTPDVYQGAPTPVTAFMSAATKVAALVGTMRLLVTAFPAEARLWTVTLAVIACISLAWGNLAALVQTDIKRLLAYSSISHAGFLLIPVAVGTRLGGRALLFYLVSYTAMSVGSFAIVAARERELARPVTFDGLAGLGWERPGLGIAMSLFMFGFIGLPPAGLFLGKFYAFSAAVDRGWTWLAIVGVAATVLSIYYYAGVIGAMYFQRSVEVRVAPAGGSPPRDWALSAAVTAAVVVTVGSFVAAGPLLDIARDSVSFLGFPH